MRKRILSLLLSLIMVLSLLPTTAWAKPGGSSGGPGGGYTMQDAENHYDHVESFDHVDVRVAGQVTYTVKTDGSVPSTVTKAATISNPTITIYKSNDTERNSRSFTNSTSYEWRWHTSVAKTDYIVITCDITVDGVTERGASFTFKGKEAFVQAIYDCDGHQGLDFIISSEDVSERFTVGTLTINKVFRGLDDDDVPNSVTFTVKGVGSSTYNQPVTLTADNNWTGTLEDIPLGTYTVTENTLTIAGYTWTNPGSQEFTITTDSYTKQLTFTNAYEKEVTTGNLTITKALAGDGVSAAANKEFTFTVKDAAGYVVDTKTITGAGSATVENLPLGTYTVTESGADITGYTLSTTGTVSATVAAGQTTEVTVTNTYTQKTTNITVEKKWEDVGGITLPDSIQVQLYKNGATKVGDPVTLNATGNWKYTFNNLLEYDGSTKITYTAKEVNVPTGFESSENGLVITNTATRGDDINSTASLTITKVDKDNTSKKLAGAEFTLVSTNLVYSQTATTDSNGVATFTGLTAGTYTLTETKAPTGYVLDNTSKTIVVEKDSGTTALGADNVYHTTYNHSVKNDSNIGLSSGAMTIQNTRSTKSITVTKEWVHNNVPTAQQPASVTVTLYKNDAATSDTLTLNASNNWNGKFENLPTHDDNGILINYTVVEGTVNGYTGAVTGSAADGFTITNTAQWTNEKDNRATLTITKVDSEDSTTELTGAEFTLTLGDKTLNSVDNNDGTYTISGIDVAGGWTLTETKAPDGYKATAATWTVAVEKSYEVKLVDVTVGETTVKKYQTENTYTITNNANIDLTNGAITVTNGKDWADEIVNKASVTVTKYNDDETEKLKGAEFTLYNDKNEVVDTATTGDDGTCTFANLTTGTYTLKETKAPTGYSLTNQTVEITVTDSSTTEINAGGKFQTTTTYTASPATAKFVNNKILINVEVTKEWQDAGAESYRSESVTVQLYKNDTAVTGKTLELNATNSWKGSFTNLPEYDGETKNVYTVKEVDPSDSYTATEGTADNGYKITNTAQWTNEKDNTATLTIKKVDSKDTTKLLSGAKFTLTDKEDPSNTMEATTGADGVASFTELQPGTYMLEEVSAPEGYKENHQVWTVVVTKNQTNTSVTKLTDGTFQKVYDCTVEVFKLVNDESAPLTANNDGSYTITNELAPTEYTAKVDIEKIVEKTGGNVAPGDANFTFVAMCDGVEKNVGTETIETTGVGTYTGKLTLTVPASAFKLDDNGNGVITLYVEEFKGTSAGWKYDDTVYELVMKVENYVVTYIGFKVESDTPSVLSELIPDGQETNDDNAAVTLSFTNGFSQTTPPSRPNKPGKPSKPITSVKTGDAGVAMYAMSGLLSLGGATLFMKKRKDEE